jgi:hypothetical protein
VFSVGKGTAAFFKRFDKMLIEKLLCGKAAAWVEEPVCGKAAAWVILKEPLCIETAAWVEEPVCLQRCLCREISQWR